MVVFSNGIFYGFELIRIVHFSLFGSKQRFDASFVCMFGFLEIESTIF
jgi:hypothetical protein